MKSFKQIREVKKPTGGLKDACWTGYTAVGMKMKGGRKVPNCVPEEVEQIDELSKETLSSYSQKAKGDADKFHNMAVKHSTDGTLDRGLMKMVGKRSMGSQKAIQRMTKEEKGRQTNSQSTSTKKVKLLMKRFKDFVKEDGMGAGAVAAGPTNVTGVATSTDPASATAVDNRDKKHRGPKNNPMLFTKPETRKPPKI